ncbi:hypothetical protein DFH09DRAFT_1105994 [Mycena vulgaris]|nr:hypothetical protein DFH09DRAFT_1105994 [Mycena vulgaris]
MLSIDLELNSGLNTSSRREFTPLVFSDGVTTSVKAVYAPPGSSLQLVPAVRQSFILTLALTGSPPHIYGASDNKLKIFDVVRLPLSILRPDGWWTAPASGNNPVRRSQVQAGHPFDSEPGRVHYPPGNWFFLSFESTSRDSHCPAGVEAQSTNSPDVPQESNPLPLLRLDRPDSGRNASPLIDGGRGEIEYKAPVRFGVGTL